jgi:hypothetical protein
MTTFIHKLKNIAFKLCPQLAVKIGIELPATSPDRIFLETEIFQYINQNFGRCTPLANCLFIGCDKHTWHYPNKLDVVLHTIDIDQKNAVFGNYQHHIVGSATELDRYYDPGFFDVIIAIDLIGFGINAREQCEQLLGGMRRLLKKDGLLILGFNDAPDKVNFKVKDSSHYTSFEEFVPDAPGLNAATYAFDGQMLVFLKRHMPQAA